MNDEVKRSVYAPGTNLRKIEDGLFKILGTVHMTRSEYCEMYNLCYDFCTTPTTYIGVGDRGSSIVTNSCHPVKLLLADTVRTHLQELLEVIGGSETLLELYAQNWLRFKTSSNIINSTFVYLNRFEDSSRHISPWINRPKSQAQGIDNVYQILLNLWKEMIYDTLALNVCDGAFKLLKEERNGTAGNPRNISTMVNSFIDLSLSFARNQHDVQFKDIRFDLYKTIFEGPYLDNLESFYKFETGAFFAQSDHSVAQYIRKAQERIREEEFRATKYLHSSSKLKVIALMNDIMIRKRFDSITTEYKRLLGLINSAGSEEEINELGNILLLVSPLEDLSLSLGEHLTLHVITEGKTKIHTIFNETEKIQDIFILTVLEVYNKYNKLAQEVLKGHQIFTKAVQQSTCHFFRKNSYTAKFGSQKPAEALARFCDRALRNSSKVTEAEVEKKLEDTMIIFKMLDDRDVFQFFYIRLLMNRLIQKSSYSDELEATMLTKLKNQSGYEYTTKMERMFHDMTLSKQLQEEFKEWVKTGEYVIGMGFQATVISSCTWPYPITEENLNLPQELVSGLDAFLIFYCTKFSGRKLTWALGRSTGELTTKIFKNSHTFVVSSYQMTLLLLFNERDSYTRKEILEFSKIDQELLDQVITPLLQIDLLHFNDGTNYNLNLNFRHKNFKINVQNVFHPQIKKVNEEEIKSIEESRQFVMRAAIVRIMKTRKVISHEGLIEEVISQLNSRFHPTIQSIKTCVQYLMEKDYVVRDKEKADIYHYVA